MRACSSASSDADAATAVAIPSCCCFLYCLQVDIDTVEKFESLRQAEQQYFIDMVQKCKDAGKQMDEAAFSERR